MYQAYSIPLSQEAAASLIGATRETTSTTRSIRWRGAEVVRLGRRQLVVPSIDGINSASAGAGREFLATALPFH